MSVDQATTEQRRWSPRARAVVAATLVAVVAVAVLGVRWWTHPTLFEDLGDSYTASVPLPVAEAALSTTVIFPRVDGEPETVTIDSVEAVFSENTAEATASFWICHLGVGEDPIGAVHDPERACADMEPFEPGNSFRHGVAPDSDYLFVKIDPASPGVARLVSVEIEYARGQGHLFQRGTQSIRVERTVRTR